MKMIQERGLDIKTTCHFLLVMHRLDFLKSPKEFDVAVRAALASPRFTDEDTDEY